MWPMIAEASLRCNECNHSIEPGRLCLSELPEEVPVGVSRADVRNYCIGCPRCQARGKHSCYLRHLDSEAPSGTTPRSLPCASCGRRIPGGEKASVELYYEWPEATEDGDESNNGRSAIAGAATISTSADLLIRGVPSGSFENLSDGLQQKLSRAGLGGDLGARTEAQAQAFYQETIPHTVRNLGEENVWKYLAGKDASHIQSVHNAPSLARENSNLVWESSDINRARGAENMTPGETFQAQAANTFDASAILFRECLETAAMTALWAALLEAPVAAIENHLHYQRGRKTGEEAVRDAAKAIASRAAVGGTVGFAVTGAVSVLGAGPLMVTIAPYLLPVGVVFYGHNALKRWQRASAHKAPPGMAKVGTYFCSPRCHMKLAYETGLSALTRWERSREPAHNRGGD